MILTFGLLLTVASGVGWVGADALRKRLAQRLSALELAAGLHLCQVPIIAVGLLLGSQLVESSELADILSWRMQSQYWLFAAPSIACNAIANLLFVRALQLSDLSLTIPYLSLTPVLAVFSGWLVLGEHPGLVGAAGVVVIAVGALLLNPSADGEPGFNPIRALKEEPGSVAMLGVACLWSVSVAFDKRALDYSSPMTHAAVLAVTGWLILDAFRRRRSPASIVDRARPVFGLLMGTTFVITVALMTQLWAYHYVDVAYVEAIKRSLGMVGSVLVGWLFFNESSIGRRIAAVGAMAAGVCLILLGG